MIFPIAPCCTHKNFFARYSWLYSLTPRSVSCFSSHRMNHFLAEGLSNLQLGCFSCLSPKRLCPCAPLCSASYLPLNLEWPLSMLLANEIIFLWIWLNVTYTNKSAALISVKINLFPAQTLPRHLVFIELLALYTMCLKLNVMCLPTPLRRN